MFRNLLLKNEVNLSHIQYYQRVEFDIDHFWNRIVNQNYGSDLTLPRAGAVYECVGRLCLQEGCQHT